MNASRQQGFTLIECIVYMALFVVVVGFATMVFFRYWDDSRDLSRHADDVVRVLHAGDQWRADLRAAHGPLQLTFTNGAEELRIPSSAGAITYTFAHGELRRQSKLLLANVQSSEMQSNAALHVPAWRWDLELQSKLKTPLWRPRFTFEAVAGPPGTP